MARNRFLEDDDDEDEDIDIQVNHTVDAEEEEQDNGTIVYAAPKPRSKGQFQKGERNGKAKKTDMSLVTSSSHNTTLAKLKDIQQLKHWMRTYGVTRVMQIMETMNDADFFKAFVVVAPYALPKIAAVENSSRDDHAPSKDKNAQVHTITIRDMRTGKSVRITDE